jgi:hypothetical protein
MKRPFFSCGFLAMLLCGCASDAFEKGWKEPSAAVKDYREDRYQFYRNGGLTPEEAAIWAQKDAQQAR